MMSDLSPPLPEPKKVSFLTFYLIWAELQGWEPPMIHVRICQWLESCDSRVRVLRVFRSAGKSTLYALYKAWQLYRDYWRRSIIWSVDDEMASRLTRDVLHIMRQHPLCQGMVRKRSAGAFMFWVERSQDARNPSIHAVGVASNAVGARADACDFDDVEVPRNVGNAEARELLRQRIGESTHILLPDGCKTYIGTPHTEHSVYDEEVAGGAAELSIPLFGKSVRYVDWVDTKTEFVIPWELGPDGLWVLGGIGKHAQVLIENVDYRIVDNKVVFEEPPGIHLDLCTDNAWPERFTRKEIKFKRQGCATYGAWDSQYQLVATTLSNARLPPSMLVPYETEVRLTTANGETSMWLGDTQIVGASARWDPSSAKQNSDVSAVAVVLQDAMGRRYWHRAVSLTGEVAQFDEKAIEIIGGQVSQLASLIKELHLPAVVVETNGIGEFAPSSLRAVLRQRGIRCGVKVERAVENKSKRILDAVEGPLTSRMLFAHRSVLAGSAIDEMRDWRPGKRNQKDDYLDSLAGAISTTPERLFRPEVSTGDPDQRSAEPARQEWRPGWFNGEMLAEVDWA
jgi:hypothetical protein